MTHATPTLAYSVLLHDVGKPVTAEVTAEPDGSRRIRFNHHANVGAEMARDILTRLRMPRRRVDAVAQCVANHMRFMDVQKMRPATLRKLVAAKTFPVELELHRLDCLCSHGDLSNCVFLKEYVSSLRQAPDLPPRWVTGRDVMDLGIPEGPEIGRWLQAAYDAQLEGKAASREELLDWLRRKMRSNDTPE
jgi:poly(A) polymerase